MSIAVQANACLQAIDVVVLVDDTFVTGIVALDALSAWDANWPSTWVAAYEAHQAEVDAAIERAYWTTGRTRVFISSLSPSS